MTAPYPEDGDLDWALDLKSYIDEIASVAENNTPGSELGYIERLSTFTTTATATGTIITGLELTVLGQGRPVDVELGASNLYHSVANTPVFMQVAVNGNPVGAQSFGTNEVSASTTSGRSTYTTRRIMLDSGVSYTFNVHVWGGAAGTSTIQAAGFAPTRLSVTSR